MGSPLFPIVVNVVMCDLEMNFLKLLSVSFSFYIRYVGDIVLAINQNYIEVLLNIFNNYHPRIKFTMKIGDTLNFFDVILIKGDTTTHII